MRVLVAVVVFLAAAVPALATLKTAPPGVVYRFEE